MRYSLVFAFFSFALLSNCNTTNGESQQKLEAPKEKSEMKAVQDKSSKLRHVVLFAFNDKANARIIGEIEEAFALLPSKIPEIVSFEWGMNNSPEGLAKGLSHCFLVTFNSEEDRATYLPHPAHQEFVSFIGPYVEDVTVVDYWTK